MIKNDIINIRLNSFNEAYRRAVAVCYTATIGRVTGTKSPMKFVMAGNKKDRAGGYGPGDANLSA